jgi:ring-1,2-phenylacetyl-CoA epoxidase subunit PaaE
MNLSIKITSIIQETLDAKTFKFEFSDPSVSYIAGQFITLKISIDNKVYYRSYSFSSNPLNDSPAITVKQIDLGTVSVYMNQKVQVGDVIECTKPAGTFVLPQQQHRQYLFIGAGSGITPLISMIKTLLHTQSSATVTLVYTNRNEACAIFHPTLLSLSQTFTNFNYLPYFTQSDQQISKRLNKSELIKIIESNEWLNAAITGMPVFVCGPNGLMDEVKDALSILKHDNSLFFSEKFNNTPEGDVVFTTHESTDEAVNGITVLYQGNEYKFEVGEQQSILEAALANKIDLPYSCMSGLCTACMGKCIQGGVDMPSQDGLSKSEVEKGYVLTCVGRPKVKNTIIEID